MRVHVNTSAASGHSFFETKFAMPAFPSLVMEAPVAREAEQPSDAVACLRRGDLKAVGALYDEHHETVRRFARRLLGEEMYAEDLVHEVFLALPRAIQSYRGDSTLGSFLLGMTVQHARHHLRSVRRRRSWFERAEKEPEPVMVGQNEEGPAERVERKQLAELLSRCLDRLSLDHRATFVLLEVEGRSSREVGDILGIPEGTVRTRLLHAKKKLREFIAEEGLR
jgi:RNA polymerase sigma-70 factor, ECF subfamily